MTYVLTEDERAIMDFYRSLPEKLNSFSGHKDPSQSFAFKVNSRLFTEWCCDPENGGEVSKNYRVRTWWFVGEEVFGEYIAQETHHELLRRGHHWDAERNCFVGDISPYYKETRARVLEAFTRRAFDFFKQCETTGNWDRPSTNLKCSLEAYLR